MKILQTEFWTTDFFHQKMHEIIIEQCFIKICDLWFSLGLRLKQALSSSMYVALKLLSNYITVSNLESLVLHWLFSYFSYLSQNEIWIVGLDSFFRPNTGSDFALDYVDVSESKLHRTLYH